MRKCIYILFISIIVIGCNRDEELNPESNRSFYYPLNSALVTNYLYQSGTWWVYKDLTDNSRDSIYVTNSINSVFTFIESPSLPGQGPKYHNYDSYEMILGGNTHETDRYYLFTDNFRTKFNLPYELTSIFTYNESVDSTVSDFNRVAFYDSIQIQNIWYYDVAKTKIYTYYHSCCPIPDLDYYYISKEFGIIRKEIANTDSTYKIYELVNKNIVR